MISSILVLINKTFQMKTTQYSLRPGLNNVDIFSSNRFFNFDHSFSISGMEYAAITKSNI